MFQEKRSIRSELYCAGAAAGSSRMEQRAGCKGTSREVRGLMYLKGDKDLRGTGGLGEERAEAHLRVISEADEGDPVAGELLARMIAVDGLDVAP